MRLAAAFRVIIGEREGRGRAHAGGLVAARLFFIASFNCRSGSESVARGGKPPCRLHGDEARVFLGAENKRDPLYLFSRYGICRLVAITGELFRRARKGLPTDHVFSKYGAIIAVYAPLRHTALIIITPVYRGTRIREMKRNREERRDTCVPHSPRKEDSPFAHSHPRYTLCHRRVYTCPDNNAFISIPFYLSLLHVRHFSAQSSMHDCADSPLLSKHFIY